jgi:hypothetical protein
MQPTLQWIGIQVMTRNYGALIGVVVTALVIYLSGAMLMIGLSSHLAVSK